MCVCVTVCVNVFLQFEATCHALLPLQEVLKPYDPNSKHLRVDKNISLRVYCKDKAPGMCIHYMHLYLSSCSNCQRLACICRLKVLCVCLL